jgi:hypothetical protein
MAMRGKVKAMSNVPSDMAAAYNKLLARFKKAAIYMDGPADIAEKEKWMPEIQEVQLGLSKLLLEFKRQGYKVAEEEGLEGFK